jgi:hypothetical protein
MAGHNLFNNPKIGLSWSLNRKAILVATVQTAFEETSVFFRTYPLVGGRETLLKFM